MRTCVLLTALALSFSLPATTQEIVLVRHAEKATSPAGDVGLTPAGQGRAEALAALLHDHPPVLILTSPARRTLDTAAPLAAQTGIITEVVAIPPGDLPAHVRATAERLATLKPGQVALVVGHGNTIPAILRALGGPTLPDLPECAYDRVFRWDVVTRALREERYGAGSGCP